MRSLMYDTTARSWVMKRCGGRVRAAVQRKVDTSPRIDMSSAATTSSHAMNRGFMVRVRNDDALLWPPDN